MVINSTNRKGTIAQADFMCFEYKGGCGPGMNSCPDPSPPRNHNCGCKDFHCNRDGTWIPCMEVKSSRFNKYWLDKIYKLDNIIMLVIQLCIYYKN